MSKNKADKSYKLSKIDYNILKFLNKQNELTYIYIEGEFEKYKDTTLKDRLGILKDFGYLKDPPSKNKSNEEIYEITPLGRIVYENQDAEYNQGLWRQFLFSVMWGIATAFIIAVFNMLTR